MMKMSYSDELIEILSLTPLEKYALFSSRQQRRKLVTSYLAAREKVADDFLPLISSKVPYMNDHSRTHIERVLYHIESLLELHFPQPEGIITEIPADRLLTWADTLILLNALIWHDIGNMYHREGHAELVRKCLDVISPYFLYDEHLKQYICQVAEAHSGQNGIEMIIPDSHASDSYQGTDIHLQFLAAVLRIADEIDEDHRRAKPNEWDSLELVPEENRRFWYFSKANSSIQINNEQGNIGFVSWICIESYIPKSEFEMKFVTNEGEIDALTEYFRRIHKIEAERSTCNKYLNTFYHPGIEGIRIRLLTHEKGESPTASQSFEFEISDTFGFDEMISSGQYVDIQEHIAKAKNT